MLMFSSQLITLWIIFRSHFQIISKLISMGRTKIGMTAFSVRLFSINRVKLHCVYTPVFNRHGLSTQHIHRFHVILAVVSTAGGNFENKAWRPKRKVRITIKNVTSV